MACVLNDFHVARLVSSFGDVNVRLINDNNADVNAFIIESSFMNLDFLLYKKNN